jgi:hypothetical protein
MYDQQLTCHGIQQLTTFYLHDLSRRHPAPPIPCKGSSRVSLPLLHAPSELRTITSKQRETARNSRRKLPARGGRGISLANGITITRNKNLDRSVALRLSSGRQALSGTAPFRMENAVPTRPPRALRDGGSPARRALVKKPAATCCGYRSCTRDAPAAGCRMPPVVAGRPAGSHLRRRRRGSWRAVRSGERSSGLRPGRHGTVSVCMHRAPAAPVQLVRLRCAATGSNQSRGSVARHASD